MSKKILPINGYVVLEVIANEEKTAGGIIIPGDAQENTQIGRVVAVEKKPSLKIKKGTKVFFRKYSGTEISIDGKDYLIIKEDNLLAIIK